MKGLAFVTIAVAAPTLLLAQGNATDKRSGADGFDPTRVLTQPLHDDRFGHYETGPVQAEWLADGRRMRILQEVRFVDPNGKRWIAPQYWIVDGASIPKAAWSIIGGPYEGKYREASVLHDYACDKKLATSKAAARMFYNAMRCSRVPEAQAKAMYKAVDQFGPHWTSLAGEISAVFNTVPATPTPVPGKLEAENMRQLLRKIEKENPSLDHLETVPLGRR